MSAELSPSMVYSRALAAPAPQADRVQQVIQKHSKSFSLASSLLPKAVRHDARVIYAWCRRADDAVDLAEEGSAEPALQQLIAELDAIYAGTPQTDPVLYQFQAVVQRHGIPKHYPSELLRGMEMDVTAARYFTQADLLLYCYRVAGTVGLMMCHVMGLSQPAALQQAAHLGIAMQLTNICRDVREDWQRGRLYLPQDLLLRHASQLNYRRLDQPLPRSEQAALASALHELLREAERYYASGDLGAQQLSPRCALAVRSARLIYSAIGVELQRANYDVFAPRAHTSLLTKLRLLAKAAWQVLRSPRPEPKLTHLPLLEYRDVRLV